MENDADALLSGGDEPIEPIECEDGDTDFSGDDAIIETSSSIYISIMHMRKQLQVTIQCLICCSTPFFRE